MRIYVDELPKNCAKCELCSHIFTNCLPNLYKCAVDGHARFAEYKVEDEEPCPLKSLADYTKQVRKEIITEIYEWCCQNHYSEDSLEEHLLNQLQGDDHNA